MRSASQLAILLLVAALGGCGRTEDPAPRADNATAAARPSGPYLFAALVKLKSSFWHDDPVPSVWCSLHDLADPNAGACHWAPGVSGGIMWDGRDESGKWVGGNRRWVEPGFSCVAYRVDNATWLARATWDDSKGESGKTIERKKEFKIKQGATVAIPMPDDNNPEFVAVFCVLPDGPQEYDARQERWEYPPFVPNAQPFLLRFAVDLRNTTHPLMNPWLTDLIRTPEGIEWAMSRGGSIPPASTEVTGALMSVSHNEGDNALTAHAEVTLGGTSSSKSDLPLSVRRGAVQVIALRVEKAPRFLFVFTVLPDVESTGDVGEFSAEPAKP